MPNVEGSALSRTIKHLLQNTAFRITLIVVLGLLAYSNTFDVPFHFDDDPHIAENPLIKDFKYILEPSRAKEAVMEYNLLKTHIFENRIVGYFTFALNWRAHGLDVRGYHIANLAIHIVNALLVYWLVVLTFRTPFMKESSLKDHAGKIALLSALLFVAHPVQTQAVTYIVQRFASLATLFYLLSLAAYVRARMAEKNPARYGLYALSLLSAVLAMKTKEIAFTLPLVITLYEFLFFSDSIKRRLIYLTPLLLTMLIIPLSMLDTDRPLGEVIGDVGEATRLETGMSRLDYLFTEFRVMVTYIRLLFLPINQNLDYDHPVYSSFLEPQVFLSFLFLASIVGLGVFLLYRSRTSGPVLKVMSFGIFWFFITLSIESSFIPIKDVIFEHRLYLPSVGAAIAMATGAAIALQRLKGGRLKTAATALIVIVPLVLTATAYKRNTVWQSNITLWEDVVRKSPNNTRAHYNLGNACASLGEYDRAIAHYVKALSIKPSLSVPYYSYAKIHYNLGSLYGKTGRLEEAEKYLLQAVTLNPAYSHAYNSLGNIYFLSGKYDKAIQHFTLAIKHHLDNFEAHTNLAVAYRETGLEEKAQEHFRIAEGLRRKSR